MPHDVKLTWPEAAMASEIGRLRQLSSIKDERKHVAGYEGDGWGNHIEGACGELAFAKFLNTYWSGHINNFNGTDVENYEVRTRSKHHYDLIIRPHDKDSVKWVLVTGLCPSYRVHGWILGKDGKQDRWLKQHGNRPEAFFIPAVNLVGFEGK